MRRKILLLLTVFSFIFPYTSIAQQGGSATVRLQMLFENGTATGIANCLAMGM